MDSILYDKIGDIIKTTIKNSNPFEKSTTLIKKMSIMVFLTFGFTILNYFTLKKIMKNNSKLYQDIQHIEYKLDLKCRKNNKRSISTSTSDILQIEDVKDNK